MYIAVSGNIGSGKSTLVDMMSKRLGWVPFFEDTENPYLDDFYQNMNEWSFRMQISFLVSKIDQIKKIEALKGDVIQDRTIFEEAYIFVENLHSMGLMPTRDYELYVRLFSQSLEFVREPDLVIYLKGSAPTFISQIQKRGREYEMGISEEYLNRLNVYYDNWIASYTGKVIVVDIDVDDFLIDDTVFDSLVEQVLELKEKCSFETPLLVQ